MSVYDKWKKSKENNIYERWKKEKQKENEELIKNPENKISSYDSLKRNTLKEIGTQIKNENEERKQQKNNSTNQRLLLPLLNQGQTININNDNVINDLSNMNYGKRASIINAITSNEKDANKLKLDTMQYQQEKETKEKANKINKDMSNGNYSSAIAHVLLGIPQKALDSTSTTFASMNSIIAPKKISNTQADENELLKTNKLLSKKYEQTTANIDNDIVKTVSGVSGTIGGMVPSILSNIALPGSGVVTQGINVGAQEYQDTLNEDASNKLQATITGAAKGIVSGLIEKISGGNIIGKGSLDESAAKFIESHFKGKVGQKLASKAYEMIGEIGEENLENQLGYVIDKIINNKELPNFQEWWNEAKETTKGTFLTTLVLNALGLGGSTYNDVQDIKGQKYLNEAKNIIRNELNNNTKINTDEKTKVLNDLNNVNTLQDYNNYLKNSTNLQQGQILEKTNNIIAPMRNLTYEESAKKYNIDTNNETVQSINKITQARGINTRFDADIFTDNNTNAIWKITTDDNGNTIREVTLNPNADTKKTLQNVIIHELTHDFEGTTEYKDLKDLILSYDEGNIGFENARKSLEDIYSKVYDKNSSEFQSLVDNEAVADILGNKLGDQDFINTLTMEKPSTARKIYNWVIDKLNKINKLTGYSNEKLFWADVKNKFENAYRQDYQGNNNNSKYSIQIDNNGNKYVKVDTDQKIFEGIAEKDYNKIAKMYIQDYLMGETSLSNNDKAVIDGKSASKYANPGKRQNYFNEKMKLTPELKNVLEIAQKDSISAPIKDTSKYQNWEYYKFNFELDGKNFEGTINIGIDKNGNKHFYEINKIHFTGISSVSTNSQHKVDSINNSIAPTKNDVNTTTKYSMQESENNTDNKGRTLTKEQQDYFKDSKVRDENGNLKTMYHGSNNKFTIFKHGEAYRGSSKASVGYWFTETAKGAENFANSVWYGDTKTGAKVYEVYLNIKNPKIYNGIDNTNELYKIDNNINNLKEKIRKLENKNIAIEINKQELRWANSKEELRDIAKYEGIDFEDAENYHNAIKQYNELIEEYDNKKYNDSYELFRADIYKIAGKSANEANIGGTGMYLSNEEEVVKQYVEDLKKQGYDGIIIKNTKFDNETLGKDNSQYVVFEPNQIKNVSNTKPTDNPDIRYSQNNQAWQSYLNENYKSTGKGQTIQDVKLPIEVEEKSQKINFPTAQDIYKMNNKEKTELLTDADYEVLNKIYEKEGKTEILTEKKKANLLEKYANDKYNIKDSLDILAQKIINKGHYIDQLAEKANNLELKFVYDKNLNSFAEGQYVVGVAQTDNQGNEIGKSINEIWEPIENSNLTKEFSEYLLHKHNIDRSERGKYIFGEEIGPAESTSIALELEKKHPEFKQYAEDIKKFNHNNLNNLKEAGMLTQDTIDYIESMYPNYIAISRNLEDSLYTGNSEKVGAIAPLKKATGGNSDIQPIKDTMAQQAIKIKRLVNQNQLGKELAKTLKNAQIYEGVDIELSPTLLLDMDTMVDTDNQGNKYYLYFENGKQLKLKINDNLYESLKTTEINKLEKTFPFKLLQKVTSIHRSLLTSSNPIFIVTNFYKDLQDGAFNSKYSSKFIKNYGKALNEIYTKGKYYQSYMANGGMTNTYFDYNEGIKKQNKFVQKIRNINEIVEQLPRLAEFISTLEDGKSLNEALYNAAEITTNFKRGGDITKALNRNGINFLNASIQGLDKQFRNFSGQNGAKGYVNLLAKATIMSIVPSVLNHMLLDDDEDYQDLPQSTKDLYYLFKYDDGKFIRIPKGRVLSIFGAAARRTIETVQGQDDAWKEYGKFIVDQIGPNNPLTDNIASPVIQTAINKTWYGGDLVSSRLQKELPENQYDETTDEFSKWLGKQIKVTPKKINYLIDQYSGGIGDILLPMITPQAKQNVLIDKFTTDSVLKNKNVSKFYETLEKQTQIANDSFATDEDQLQLKYLNSISKDMSDLYKQKREIQMSDISNKEKTKKVKEIQLQINELAEKGLNNYSDVDKTNNSSKIGDEEYYRDSKGNWTSINEEEKQKIGDLSLDTYSDYKQIVYKKTQEKRNNGELTKKQDLKNKDKIQILLDSKYSNKEITAIYENYIKNAKDTQYDIISKSGINIKEYLKYKQQEFESDKKEDGTTTGKTISGSKKKKEYNYVNSMNITYEQKLLLLGMNYTLTNKEQTKLANYVNNMKLTKQEKLDIYEKLEGFTVYKNGRVTW